MYQYHSTAVVALGSFIVLAEFKIFWAVKLCFCQKPCRFYSSGDGDRVRGVVCLVTRPYTIGIHTYALLLDRPLPLLHNVSYPVGFEFSNFPSAAIPAKSTENIKRVLLVLL